MPRLFFFLIDRSEEGPSKLIFGIAASLLVSVFFSRGDNAVSFIINPGRINTEATKRDRW